MTDDVSEAGDLDVQEEGVVKSQLTTLVTDFRSLAAAELEYIKVRAAYSGRIAKWTGIYVVLALVAISGALIIIALGSLQLLAAQIGLLAATIAISLGLILFAIICARLARRSALKLVFKHSESDKDG